MSKRISEGTRWGMIRWYRTRVPRCPICRATYLVRHDRRKKRICARCERNLGT